MIRNCYCNTCTIITGTVAVDGTNLVITPTTTVSPENEDKVCLVVTNRVPTAAGMTLPVVITLGGAQVPVYDKFGNIVYGSSLRTNTIIKAYYGVNGTGGTAHLQVVNQPFTVSN